LNQFAGVLTSATEGVAASLNTVAERLDNFLNSQKHFLANIAHEVSSPLGRLQLALEILQEHLRDEAAFIQRANLIGADLSMANLRGASLVQADLREANLLGTELRGANLMGANLYGAEGVWVGRYV